MKVRELLALMPVLEEADLEDTVIIDADSKFVLLLNTRPGLFQPVEDPAQLRVSEDDAKFLRSLQICS